MEKQTRRKRGESVRADEYNIVKYTTALYTLRTTIKANQAEMAKLLGVAQSTYARNELGDIQFIYLDFVNTVCEKFKVDRDYLLAKITDVEEVDPDLANALKWLKTKEAAPYILNAYKTYLADKEHAKEHEVENNLKAFLQSKK